MKESMKRLITIILIIAMVTGMVPASVMAEAAQAVDGAASAYAAKQEEAQAQEAAEKVAKEQAEAEAEEARLAEQAEKEEEARLAEEAEKSKAEEAQGKEAPASPSAEPTTQEADPTAQAVPTPTPLPVDIPTPTVTNAMTVTQDPQSVDANKGDTVTFTADINADNPAGVSYQWQKSNDGSVSGACKDTDTAINERINELNNLSEMPTKEEIDSLSSEDKTEYEAEKAEEKAAAEANGNDIVEELPTQSEKVQELTELIAKPMGENSEGWEDISGATNRELTVKVDDQMATSMVTYRLVAKSQEATVATAAASVRNTSQFGGGNGTAEDPYLIYNGAHYDNVRNFTGGRNADEIARFENTYFLQMADIGYLKTSFPIGNAHSPFRGNYNGNGYKIGYFDGELQKQNDYANYNVPIIVNNGSSTWSDYGFCPGPFGYTERAHLSNVAVDASTSYIGWYNTKGFAMGNRWIVYGGIIGNGIDTILENSYVINNQPVSESFTDKIIGMHQYSSPPSGTIRGGLVGAGGLWRHEIKVQFEERETGRNSLGQPIREDIRVFKHTNKMYVNSVFTGKIDNCYVNAWGSVKWNGNYAETRADMAGTKACQIWEGYAFGSVFAEGNNSSQTPEVTNTYYNRDVEASYYTGQSNSNGNTTNEFMGRKSNMSAGGSGMSKINFTNNTVLNKLEARSKDQRENNGRTDWAAWERGSNGWPTLRHMEPIHITVKDWTPTWDGKAKEPTYITNHPNPEITLGKDWLRGFYDETGKAYPSDFKPTDVGTYYIHFWGGNSQDYYLGTIRNDPADSTIDYNKKKQARFIIKPKEDKRGPSIDNIIYTTEDGKPYTPGTWTDKNVTVRLKVSDPNAGELRQVKLGDETVWVDKDNNLVSTVVNPVVFKDGAGFEHKVNLVEGNNLNGTYEYTWNINEGDRYTQPQTIITKDTAGNETKQDVDNISINKAGPILEVKASRDQETTWNKLTFNTENKAYHLFARDEMNFDITAYTVGDGITLNDLEYQFVAKGQTPVDGSWTKADYTGQNTTRQTVQTDPAKAPFDGSLYIRSGASNNRASLEYYLVMVENSAPQVGDPTVKAKMGTENGAITTVEPYVEGKTYQNIVLDVPWADTDTTKSGVDNIKVYKDFGFFADGTISSEQVKDYTTGKNPDKTGPVDGINFDKNGNLVLSESGDYRFKYTIKDVAGNTSTRQSEVYHVEAKQPSLKVEWTDPSGDQKTWADRRAENNSTQKYNYAFGAWSDKKPEVTLSLENKEAIKFGVTYQYRYANTGKNEAIDGKEWITINNSALAPNKDQKLKLDQTEGNYTYEFRVITQSHLTNNKEARNVKIDTTMPDEVQVTAPSPNDKGWYTTDKAPGGGIKVDMKVANSDVSTVTAYYETWWKLDNSVEGNGVRLDGSNIRLNDKPNLCGNFKTGSSVTKSYDTDGVYTLRVWTLDEAGNKTGPKDYVYKIDKTGSNIGGEVEPPNPDKPELTLGVYHGDVIADNKLNSFKNPDSFKFFKKDPEATKKLTINVADASSKVEKIEYLLCQTDKPNGSIENGKWKDATIENGAWQTYNKDNKPNLGPDYRGSVFIKITDHAGNRVNYHTENFVLDKTKPEVKITPVQDISKWQQKVTLKVEISDVTAGLNGITISEKYGLDKTEEKSYEIAIDDFEDPSRIAFNTDNRVLNFKAKKDVVTGLFTGVVTFDYISNFTSYDRNTPNKIIVKATDQAKNEVTVPTIKTYIDDAKPEVDFVLKKPVLHDKWFSIPYEYTINNPNEAPEGNSPVTKTRSKITYYYRFQSDAADGWRNINEQPKYDSTSLKLTEDRNENVYFKAVSESGVESDITTPESVKIDTKNPETPEVKVEGEHNKKVDGSDNEWFVKTYPKIKITPIAWDKLGAPEMTYYKLYQGDGSNAKVSTLGQTILNSSFNAGGDTTNTGIKKDINIDSETNMSRDVLEKTETKNNVTVNGGAGNRPYVKPEPKDVTIEKDKINVLYIYVPYGDILQSWLLKAQDGGNRSKQGSTYDRYGNNTPNVYSFTKSGKTVTLNVSAVSIYDFNKAPNSYLKAGFGTGAYCHDLVTMGMADQNGQVGFSLEAEQPLREYMNAGNGFLVGHDSIFTETENWKNRPAGISRTATPVEGNGRNYVLTTVMAGLLKLKLGSGAPGNWNDTPDKRINVKKTGYITRFPYDIGNLNGKIPAGDTHSNNQTAEGDVWMNFAGVSDATAGNFYLTTNGNVGMSQIGHENKSATPEVLSKFSQQECQLLVNTIVYLAQKPTSQFATVDGKPKQVTAVIRDRAQLDKIRAGDPNYPKDGIYVLDASIDLNGFAPIPNFAGAFDGGESKNVLSNGTLFANTTDEITKDEKKVKTTPRIANVNLDNAQLVSGENKAAIVNCTSKNAEAPLVGSNKNTISYCKVYGDDESKPATINQQQGGIANSSTGNISDCYVNANITANGPVGGITGTMTGDSIRYCTFKGSITSNDDAAGGITGLGDSLSVNQCKVESSGTISGTISGTVAGGIVGKTQNKVEISESKVTGKSVTATAGNAGGITSELLANDKINNVSYTGGTVSGLNAGGIAGKTAVDSSVRTVTAAGTVTGSVTAGGIVGENAGTVENAVETASVSGTAPIRGGVAGKNTGNILTSSASGSVADISTTDTIGGFVGLHEAGSINGCSTDKSNFVGTNYKPTDTNPIISADGIYTLEVWTEDDAIDGTTPTGDVEKTGVKNKSNVYKEIIKVDITAPNPFDIFANDGRGEDKIYTPSKMLNFGKWIYNNTTNITLKADATVSGIDNIDYETYHKTDDTENRDGTKEEKLSNTVKSDMTTFGIPPYFKGYINANATDNAGNVSELASEGLLIDSDVPKTLATVEKIDPNNTNNRTSYDYDWTNQNVEIKLSYDKTNGKNPVTPLSGDFNGYQVSQYNAVTGKWSAWNNISSNTPVQGLTFKISGINNSTVAVCTLNANTNEQYRFRAKIKPNTRTDITDVSIESQNVTVKIDKDTPSVVGPVFDKHPVTFQTSDGYSVYSEAPTLSIRAKESGDFVKYQSGINSQKYTLVKENTQIATTEKEYVNPFLVNDGKYKLSFNATDRATNNTSFNPTSVNFIVDTQKPKAPVITTTPSLDAGGYTDQTITITAATNDGTNIPVSGYKNESGSTNNGIYYQTTKDGVVQENWKPYPPDGVKITTDGNWELHFKVVTNAGHESDLGKVTINREADFGGGNPDNPDNPHKNDFVVTTTGGTVTTDKTVSWTNQTTNFDLSSTGVALFHKDNEKDNEQKGYVKYKGATNHYSFVHDIEGVSTYRFKAENKAKVGIERPSSADVYTVALDTKTPNVPQIGFSDTEEFTDPNNNKIDDKWYDQTSLSRLKIFDGTQEEASDFSPRHIYYKIYADGIPEPEEGYTAVLDENAKSFKLEELIKQKGIGAWIIKVYTKDTAGNQSATATQVFKYAKNDTLPTVTITPTGEQVKDIEDYKWYRGDNKPLSFTIAATDKTIGIKDNKIEYRLVKEGDNPTDNEGWQQYNGPFTVDNFKGKLQARAYNLAGNKGDAKYQFIIDSQKPDVSIKDAKDKSQGSWTKEDFDLRVKLGDKTISGFGKYQYKKGDDWVDFVETQKVDRTKDFFENVRYNINQNGQSTVTVRSVNGVGIPSDPVSFDAWLDKGNGDPNDPNNPNKNDFKLIVDESKTTLDGNWSADAKYKASISGSTNSGVDSYYYTTETDIKGNPTNWKKFDGNLIADQTTDAAGQTYYFKATTKTGVDSNIVEHTAYIDHQKPQKPTSAFTGTKGNNGWYKKIDTTSAALYSAEHPNMDIDNKDRTGVHLQTLLKLETEATDSWKQSDSAGTITTDGIYTFGARAVDKAGNISAMATPKTLKVDNTIPEIKDIDIQLADQTSGGLLGHVAGLYKDTVRVTVTATDKLSGIDTIGYQLVNPDGSSSAYKWLRVDEDNKIAVNLPKGFNGNVRVKTQDIAGNISTETLSGDIRIEAEKPAVTITLKPDATNGPNTQNWYKGNLPYTVSAGDDTGLFNIKIYVTNGPNITGATPVVDQEFSKESGKEVKTYNSPDLKTALSSENATITVIAEDLAGNINKTTETFKIEEKAPAITIKQTKQGDDTMPYYHDATAYNVMTDLIYDEPVSGTATILYQTDADGSKWTGINSFPQRRHVQSQDVKANFNFKVTTVAGNTAEKDAGRIWIETKLPDPPVIKIEDKKGNDVNGVWVNELPVVRQVNYPGAPGEDNKILRDNTEYVLEIRDISRNDNTEEFIESQNINLQESTNIYKLNSVNQDKEGQFVITTFGQFKDKSRIDSKNQKYGNIMYDITAPEGYGVSYGRENGETYMYISISDNLSGGQKATYRAVKPDGTETTGTWKASENGSVFMKMKTSDFPSDATLYITSMTDNAGNTKTIQKADQKPLPQPPAPEDITGLDITFKALDKDGNPISPVYDNWYNQNPVKIQATIKVVGTKKPYEDAPEENSLSGIQMSWPENGTTNFGDPIFFGTTENPATPKEYIIEKEITEQGKDLVFNVTADDVWGHNTNGSFVFSHDSIKPDAPQVQFYVDGIEVNKMPTGKTTEVRVAPDYSNENSDSTEKAITSPLVSWQYTLDGKSWSDPMAITGMDGEVLSHTFPANTPVDKDTFGVRINDKTQNMGKGQTKALNMRDITPPKSLSLTEADGTGVNSSWSNDPTSRILVAHATDPAGDFVSTGLASWTANINGKNADNKAWETDNSLTIAEEGIHTIFFNVKDKAGNSSQSESVTIRRDFTKPTVTISTKQKPVKDPNIFDTDIDYTLHLKDTTSGIKNATYQVDGGKVNTVDGGFDKKTVNSFEVNNTLYTEGEHSIKVSITDNAGNTTEETYTLIINRKAPTLTILSPKNGEKDVDPVTEISFKGDEALYKGDGYLRLYEKKTDKQVGELHVSNNRVSIAGETVTLRYPLLLDPNTEYYVQIDKGSVHDAAGTGNTETFGKEVWSFRTKAEDTKVRILGFDVDLVKRKDPQSKEEVVRVAAIISSDNPKSYNILTSADYIGDDNQEYVKMTVYPKYSTEPAELKITATNRKGEDVSRYITKKADGSIDCVMPNSEEKIDIKITIGNDPNNSFNIVILNTEFEAEVTKKDVEAKADKDAILNSVDLSEEANNALVKKVNVVLNVEKKTDIPVEEEKQIEEKIQQVIEAENRQNSNIKRFDLDISMFKQVESINEEGAYLPTQVIPIYNLQNPLNITIGIPEELQQDYTYQILRIHNGVADTLIPEVNDIGTELTFATDRLSTYSLIALPKRVSLSYGAQEGGSITGSANQTIDIKTDAEAIEATANQGWHFEGWSDGVMAAKRQDQAVREDLKVTASFKADTPDPPVPPVPPTPEPPVPTPAPPTPEPTPVPTAQSEDPITRLIRSVDVTSLFGGNGTTNNPNGGNDGADNPQKTEKNTPAGNDQNVKNDNGTTNHNPFSGYCIIHWIILLITLVLAFVYWRSLKKWKKDKKALEERMDEDDDDL